MVCLVVRVQLGLGREAFGTIFALELFVLVCRVDQPVPFQADPRGKALSTHLAIRDELSFNVLCLVLDLGNDECWTVM